MRPLLFAVLAPLLFSTAGAVESARAPGDAAPMMAVDTPSFVTNVTSANAFEIKSSELAIQKSKDGDIHAVAEMIISDHKMAAQKLQEALKQSGAAEPQPDAPLAPKHDVMLSQLGSATGADFDMLYLDMQLQAHVEAVALFRTYGASGDNQTVVGFAKETLPRLETHLGHVMRLIRK